MEFLGIGYQELLLVLVLLLVVVGPERLPTMAYQIGRAVRTMQGYARAVRDEFKDEIDYIDEQYRTVKGQVEDTRGMLRDESRKLNDELREVGSTVDSTVAMAAGGFTVPPEVAPTATDGTTSPPATPEPSAPPMVF